MRLWDLQTGAELHRFQYHEPCRAVRYSVGEAQAAISTDPFMQSLSTIRIVNIAADPAQQSDEVVQTMTGPRGRISRLEWTDANRTLISASEDGIVRRWDVEVRGLESGGGWGLGFGGCGLGLGVKDGL